MLRSLTHLSILVRLNSFLRKTPFILGPDSFVRGFKVSEGAVKVVRVDLKQFSLAVEQATPT